MRWLFLIPLSTSLITGYIAQKSADEITYLSAAITVVTLLLSLVMAPWQVQLLILIVAVFVVRQFWLRLERNKISSTDTSLVSQEISQSDRENNQESTEETIIRKYRGASYKVKIPKINVTEIEREGKYRGADFTVRYLQKEKEEGERE